MAKLFTEGYAWSDLYTQCVFGNFFLSVRTSLPYDRYFCDVTPTSQSTSRDAIQDLSTDAMRLLERYLGGRGFESDSGFVNRFEPEAYRGYDPYELGLEPVDAFDRTGFNELDAIYNRDRLEYPQPDIYGGFEPMGSYGDNGFEPTAYGDDRFDSTLRLTPYEVLVKRAEKSNPQKDDFVKVHKYLKSHKRARYAPSVADYYDFENAINDDNYDYFNDDLSQRENAISKDLDFESKLKNFIYEYDNQPESSMDYGGTDYGNFLDDYDNGNFPDADNGKFPDFDPDELTLDDYLRVLDALSPAEFKALERELLEYLDVIPGEA